jgi:hypothetical protein
VTPRPKQIEVPSLFIAEAIVDQWAAGNGVPAPISVIVPRVTGSSAHTFAQWAAEFR